MSWQGVSNYMEHHLDLSALHCFSYKDMGEIPSVLQMWELYAPDTTYTHSTHATQTYMYPHSVTFVNCINRGYTMSCILRLCFYITYTIRSKIIDLVYRL